ncbi:MAG: hypothetical protein HC888_18250 [Candidatus Competibacteraceae bacterium]|nr:hypothetical protein [Candidatus Competibacteraceae bacterium]
MRYADDFVILCRKGQGNEILRRTELWMTRNGLQLNAQKTRLVDFDTESFEFVGFRMSWRKSHKSGKHYVHKEASPKSCAKLRERIRQETARRSYCEPVQDVIDRVNAIVRGWVGYFHHGNSTRVFGKTQRYLRQRVRRWLWRRHGCTRGLYSPRRSDTQLHQHYGLIQLPLHASYNRNA